MKYKKLKTLLQLHRFDAKMKKVFIGYGKGKSNDDVLSSCWKDIRRQVAKEGNHVTFRARSIFLENISEECYNDRL